ncbi:MAG: isoprenyl transferase [Candidatus Omnitrophica bacterium]|nr:isoprenyl transferase [Candidatus Omnitrophota bacterium]
MIEQEHLPRHIAIIMDGNGRWAAKRALPRVFGHRTGVQRVRDIVEACCDLGVEFLTLYAFSAENWQRPAMEIADLMGLLEEFIRREVDELHANRVRLNVIGRLSDLPSRIQEQLRDAITLTRHHTRLCLNLALSYGGRQELVDAVRSIARLVSQGSQSPELIDENTIARHLYTAGQPDPDLLIRTSGELRLSNFLLWQISYSELYVTPTLWPDFGRAEFEQAILEYQRRDRRFGRSQSPAVPSAPPPDAS